MNYKNNFKELINLESLIASMLINVECIHLKSLQILKKAYNVIFNFIINFKFNIFAL